MDRLRELQLVEGDMLKQLDALCVRHHIDYFIIGGTALGAIRHKGFIPWDDDVDVGILRKDFERLKEAVSKDWKEKDLFLLEGGNEKFYHDKIFARIYKRNTIFESASWINDIKQKENERKPVWLDVFIFDYVDSKIEMRTKLFLSYLLKKCHLYSKYRFNYSKNMKRMCKATMKNMLHFMLCLFKPKLFCALNSKICAKDHGKYLATLEPFKAKPNHFYLENVIFPVRRVQFEDFEVNSPCNPEAYLSTVYGDYMALPPVEERVGHIPQVLVLNNPSPDKETKS